MLSALEIDGSNWDTWSDYVIIIMEDKGCSPEAIEATTDSVRQYQLYSALFVLLKTQAGVEFHEKIIFYGGPIREKQGRAAWSQLKHVFEKPPGLKNLQKVEAFHTDVLENISITH